MTEHNSFASLTKPGKKIVLFVVDGIGGFTDLNRSSELTLADIPNLDSLAGRSALGLVDTVERGITPGSLAGHLGLFGYPPLEYSIGRGLPSALGLGIDPTTFTICARANFCTLDKTGKITDRRAGRMGTAEAERLVSIINREVYVEGAEFKLYVEWGHRLLLTIAGDGLEEGLSDSDPQAVKVNPLPITPLDAQAANTAFLINEYLGIVAQILTGQQANYILLRGFSKSTQTLPNMADRFGLKSLGIASNPFYIGIAKLIGMATCKVDALSDLAPAVRDGLAAGYDFIYLHTSSADIGGENGDLDEKIKAIEEIDSIIPDIMHTGVEVLALTGDHATPTQLSAHSWHPVPLLLHGGSAGADSLFTFDERTCRSGSLGRFTGKKLMPQILAAAGRLGKYDTQNLPSPELNL